MSTRLDDAAGVRSEPTRVPLLQTLRQYARKIPLEYESICTRLAIEAWASAVSSMSSKRQSEPQGGSVQGRLVLFLDL